MKNEIKDMRLDYYKHYPFYKVTPKNKILDDKSTVWEYALQCMGWNDLPDEEKFGELMERWSDGGISVYWPAFDCVLNSVIFLDEVDISGKQKKIGSDVTRLLQNRRNHILGKPLE